MTELHTRIVVVGGGINGLCTAWQLATEFAGTDVVVIDPLPPGHGRGSSHGAERIIRTSYESVAWVRAATRARNELWPRLEADLKSPLIVPGPAVFWGPEAGPLPGYAAAVRGAGAHVDELDPSEARRRFPRMSFPAAERVLLDHHAGVIAADRTLRGLDGWLREAGVVRLQHRVIAMEEDGAGVLVRTEDVNVRCDAVIVTAGPWVGRLVPSFAGRVRPVRQNVGYWPMTVVAGRDPAWVHLGLHGLHYGLPTLAGGVMKAAFHHTDPTSAGSAGDDPDNEPVPDPVALAQVHDRLVAWFTDPLAAWVSADTCFYTNAPDDTFLIEEAPGSRRILIVSACSGHAFKLAPLTGEAAARWAVGVAD